MTIEKSYDYIICIYRQDKEYLIYVDNSVPWYAFERSAFDQPKVVCDAILNILQFL